MLHLRSWGQPGGGGAATSGTARPPKRWALGVVRRRQTTELLGQPGCATVMIMLLFAPSTALKTSEAMLDAVRDGRVVIDEKTNPPPRRLLGTAGYTGIGGNNRASEGTRFLPVWRWALNAVDPTSFFYGYVHGTKIHSLAAPIDGTDPDLDGLDPPVKSSSKRVERAERNERLIGVETSATPSCTAPCTIGGGLVFQLGRNF